MAIKLKLLYSACYGIIISFCSSCSCDQATYYNIATESYKGRVLNKFYDSLNKGNATIVLENEKEITRILLYCQISTFNEIQIGDTISKEIKSETIYVRRMGESMSLTLKSSFN
jgi:hypothetical protein